MKTETIQIQKTIYRSEKFLEIWSESSRDKETIEFLDEHPVIMDIVTKTKSKAFGRKSCVYIGWAQKNNSPEAILAKVHTFIQELEKSGIFGWKARFTLNHYKNKGFKGGFFQQWDEQFPRGCLSLDFTPESLAEAIEEFRAWCGDIYYTKRITVDDLEVWTE